MPRTHLVLSTPCYDGVGARYMISVLKLDKACRERGIELSVQLTPGISLITHARAKMVTRFLAEPGATHMLMVDADISFEPDQVFRLLDFGADFVSAVAPAKTINWEKAANAAREGRSDLAAASFDYVMHWPAGFRAEAKDGFAKLPYTGTGFLMLRREVLERLCAAHPELRFRESGGGFALFNPFVKNGTYLGEDIAFCMRWADLGGDMWVDLTSRLEHTGNFTFAGDLSAQIKRAAPAHSK